MSFWDNTQTQDKSSTPKKSEGFWDSMPETKIINTSTGEVSVPKTGLLKQIEEKGVGLFKKVETLGMELWKGLETKSIEPLEKIATKGKDIVTSLLLPGSTPETLKEAGEDNEWKGIVRTVEGLPQATWDVFKEAVFHPVKTYTSVEKGLVNGLIKSTVPLVLNTLFAPLELDIPNILTVGIPQFVLPMESIEALKASGKITPSDIEKYKADIYNGIKKVTDKYLSLSPTESEIQKSIAQGWDIAGQATPYMVAASLGGEAGMASGIKGGKLLGEATGFIGVGQMELPTTASIEERANQAATDLAALGLFKVGSFAFGKVKGSFADMIAKTEEKPLSELPEEKPITPEIRRGTKVRFQWSFLEKGKKEIYEGIIDDFKGNDFMIMTEKPKKAIYQVPIENIIEIGQKLVVKGIEPLPGEPSAERPKTITLYAGLDPGIDKFIAEDIKPSIPKIKEGVGFAVNALNTIKDALINIIEPAKIVEKKLGESAYADVIRTIHTPEAEFVSFDTEYSRTFDANFMEIEKFFNKFSDADLEKLNLTRGTPASEEAIEIQENASRELNPQLNDLKFLTAIKEASDYVYKYALKNGIDLNYMKDYFYGSYKNPKIVSRFLDYWNSTEKYTKEKVFPTVADAKAFGLELRNKNPITNIKTELRDISYRVALKDLKTKVIAEGKDYAVMENMASDFQLKNWDRINDPVFNGMLFDPKYSKFVNNLIETNKIPTNLFLKGFRDSAKVAQVVKFFGSLFHFKNMLKAAVSDETAGIFNWNGYKNFVKAFKPIELSDPVFKDYVNLGGGKRYSVEVSATEGFSEALNKMGNGNYLGGLLRLPKAILGSKYIPASPGFIKWMFEDFIPKLKFEKFKENVGVQSEKLGRELTNGEKIKIIKNIQNFYGEMNERLFGRSATITSGLRLIFTAPGFGEGNFRALFKAGMDKTSARFVFNSLVTTATVATIGTAIMTGKFPNVPKNANELRDLFKIKTNMKDAKGDSVYFDQLTYDKDYWSVIGNAMMLQFGQIPIQLSQRISGMISTPARVLTDLSTLAEGGMVYDYKGEPLWFPADTFVERLNKLISREIDIAQPISFSVFEKVFGGQGSALSSMVGGLVSSMTGERPGTSEAVKQAKQQEQELYGLQDAKSYKQSELNKLSATDIEGAKQQARDFNKVQEEKLISILSKYGVKSIPQSIIDKYIIRGLNPPQTIGTVIRP